MTQIRRFDTNLPSDVLLALAKAPVQRVERKRDLADIVFTEGVAAVMVDAAILPAIAVKNADRTDAHRIDALRASIRAKGYQPLDPIICRIGRKGKWVVVDGGHRLTALRRELRSRLRLRLLRWLKRLGLADFLPRLIRRWLRTPAFDVYFILFKGERSLTRL